MFHTAAYLQSVDPAGAYVQLAAIADQELSVNTPKILVPTLNQVIALAAGLETTIVPRARLVSPTLLKKWRHQIAPFNGAAGVAVAPMSPHRIEDLRFDPIVLTPQENLTAEILSDPVGGLIQWVIVWLADGPVKVVDGPSFTARATVASALVSSVWTVNNLTFDDDLPRGKYQIVGFRAVSTSMIASRLLVPSQAFRPGCLGNLLTTDIGDPMFRYGNIGEYGQFESTNILQVESLAAAADTAASQIYYLDLIQLREGAG